MALLERIRRKLEWLEHGKTVVEILFAVGSGSAATALVRQLTHIPSYWRFSIGSFTAAFVLWLLIRLWPSQSELQQSSQALTRVVELGKHGGRLEPAVVNVYYHRINPAFSKEVEDMIKQTATQLSGAERVAHLFRALTLLVVYTDFEIIWYSIFASQLHALQRLNSEYLRREELRPFYAAAATSAPGFYAGYSFDSWLGYMRTKTLIREDGDAVRITVKGRDFLKFLIDEARPLSVKTN